MVIGDDYLVVVRGSGPPENNNSKQPGTQYSLDYEIHYYKFIKSV